MIDDRPKRDPLLVVDIMNAVVSACSRGIDKAVLWDIFRRRRLDEITVEETIRLLERHSYLQ